MSTAICEGAFDSGYAAMHDFAMRHIKPADLVRKMLEQIPKQTELAARLSTGGRDGIKFTQTDISRMLNQGQKPGPARWDRMKAVGIEMGVLPDDVRSEDVAASLPENRPATVQLKGYVGASGEMIAYRISDEDFEEVPAPENANDQTVAVEIRGKSLGPLLESFLVFYDDVRSPVTPDLIGRLCVVGLADDRILVKRIERAGSGYRLVSNIQGEAAIENAQIEWAARVTALRPR